MDEEPDARKRPDAAGPADPTSAVLKERRRIPVLADPREEAGGIFLAQAVASLGKMGGREHVAVLETLLDE